MLVFQSLSRSLVRPCVVLALAASLVPAVKAQQADAPSIPADRRQELGSLQARLNAARAHHDFKSEAVLLLQIGDLYSSFSLFKQALSAYADAADSAKTARSSELEADSALRTGQAHRTLGDDKGARSYCTRAVELYEQLSAHAPSETVLADYLNSKSTAYVCLGQDDNAVLGYERALSLYRRADNRQGEAAVLANLGEVNFGQVDAARALEIEDQALAFYRSLDDPFGAANTLDHLGNIYEEIGQLTLAIHTYTQSLAAYRNLEDLDGEAQVLEDLGLAYLNAGKTQEALESLQHSLDVAAGIGDPLITAQILHDLAAAEKPTNPALAIYFAKRSVNLIQQVRSNIQNLDKRLEQSFVKSREADYHDLADLLIAQGRLPEAQQVLDLLKQQEYTDYVRGNPANMLGALSLTPAEQQAEADYQQSTAQLVSLGRQWAALKKVSQRTPAEEQQFQQISDELSKANQGLNDYYSRLYKLLGAGSDANKQMADVKGDVAALRSQIARMPNTVALYTVLTSDHYRVIVVTGSATVARDYPIAQEDLNQKIAAFQQVLRDPARDPQPIAQELYKILIGPVKADLDQAGAQTLVWSLDGVLRYIPLAALYDGSHYLVENYNLVSITPAGIPHLADRPQTDNINALAMGISRQYENDLNPLPAVQAELDDIVRDPKIAGADGVLPGSILLNSQFTERAMEQQLDGRHPIVHIASHFVFKPGDDNASYLLLAGKDTDSAGYHLTVADFRDNQNLSLDGTDLLTLSACDTGVGGNAGNGREVDGLAMTAQLKGAKAVISSLWEVNDASTGELMADFYKRWADGKGQVMKVEALRQAQLDLLHGRIKPASRDNPAKTNAPNRGLGVAAAAATFAHPYYWAPFVLTGNWR